MIVARWLRKAAAMNGATTEKNGGTVSPAVARLPTAATASRATMPNVAIDWARWLYTSTRYPGRGRPAPGAPEPGTPPERGPFSAAY